eukprot:scaffold104965_cov39-Phaeocystis_antarctica.AAC.1
MYVVDPNDATVLMPPGAKGEICIGGIQVAYGYFNRPELTAEKFVPNPHGAPGLLYRTGDLGTMSADGLLQYNGRSDRQVTLTLSLDPDPGLDPNLRPNPNPDPNLNQVKVGGVRIELGEIEAVVLKRFPSLLNVAGERRK